MSTRALKKALQNQENQEEVQNESESEDIPQLKSAPKFSTVAFDAFLSEDDNEIENQLVDDSTMNEIAVESKPEWVLLVLLATCLQLWLTS